MKKCIANLIVALIIALITIFSLTNFSYATKDTEDRKQTIDGVISGADKFINSADTNNTIDQGSLKSTIDLIYNILLAIGLIVAVTAGAVLGVQFMMASADGKAEVKEKLIPYTIGCTVIFGAFGIWKLVMLFIGTM
mgnify:FL=1